MHPDAAHPSLLLPLDAGAATLPLVGGKGANLARLARAGFPVPAGFLITTAAYRAFVAANDLCERIQAALPPPATAALEACERASAHIRSLFRQGHVPDELAAQITAAYAHLGRPPVAVRSSATAEDLPELSFAGQQDTYLNVVGGDALLAAVVDCWASLWTARAISYRTRNRISHSDVSLAVVVQRMVESQASGVLFTANPLTGLRTETVIDATVGLGEALVSGQVEPDHYVVDSVSGQITSRTLGAKALSVRGRSGGGTITVAEAGAPVQALPDEQILALAALGQRVARLYAAPQDIEWATSAPFSSLERGRGGEVKSLHLLQARPITSLFPLPAGMPAEPLTVMLSFGALQGMLDPITPLGRDLLRLMVAGGARLFGMRVTPETQRAIFEAGERLWVNLTPILRNTVGRRIMPVVTGFVDPAAGETLAGLREDGRLQPGRPGLSTRAARQLARFLVPIAGNVLLNILAPQRRRRTIVDRGERLLDEMAARCARLRGDPRSRLAQLARFVPALITRHLPGTFRLFVSGVASGMASFTLLKKVTAGLPGVSPDRALEVTRGLPNNPTTEMDLALWQVAQAIRCDPASRTAFREQDSASLAADFLAGRLPEVAQATLAPFMARYGARGLAEIDLGRPRWSEEPAHVMAVIAGYLKIEHATQAPDAVFACGAASASAVIEDLAAAAQRGRHGWFKARLVRFAAGRARMLMALRESPKFFAVRLFGAIRGELLKIGQALTATGELNQPDDLFYLSFAELEAFAADESTDWAGLIAQRREAFRREGQRRQLPRLLLSDGRAFYEGLRSAAATDGVITGGPVSPGSVAGHVRVVLDPRQAGLLPGEIMVCRGTDPSWTPLFLTAAGLVMEVGGLMTHGAVVAREYGIPAVVGVDRATERLRTGQRILLNGSTGEIRLVNGGEDHAPH